MGNHDDLRTASALALKFLTHVAPDGDDAIGSGADEPIEEPPGGD